MIPATFSKEEKREIATHIKPISFQQLEKEMNQLIEIGTNAHRLSPRSNLGNNVVDYFTFVERLETKGKYDITFFDFVANIETFREKKFIQTMLQYYADVKNKKNTKHPHKVLKEVYNICISAINIMRPLNCMEIFTRYNATQVLNFCAGWGGSMVAAAALHLDRYTGIEINDRLREPYDQMMTYLRTKSKTQLTMYFKNAVDFEYASVEYDLVFSSPPYYFIEKYPNNLTFHSKQEMEERFYTPVFTKTYQHLKPGGHYVINICKEVYDKVLKRLLGEAHDMFPLKKSKRQNNYTEMVYVWKKEINT